MSRTIRRKGIDVYYKGNYTKAHGPFTDYQITEGKYGPYLSFSAVMSEREIIKSILYNHGDGKRYYSIGTRMTADNRKLDEHKFRTKEKGKITRFLKGIDDDVIAEDLPKFAAKWW